MCRKTTYFVKVLRKNKILLDLSLHLGNWLQKEWFESYILQTKHYRRKFLRIWVYLCVVKIWQLKFSGWAFLNTPVIQILPTGQWGCSPWSVPKISHSLDVRLKSLSVSAVMFEEERSGERRDKKLDSEMLKTILVLHSWSNRLLS